MNENQIEWKKIKFGELVEGIRGVSYQPHQLMEDLSSDSAVLLRANNIQNGKLIFEDIQIIPKKIIKPSQLLVDGDITVCMSNGSKNLVGKSAKYDANLLQNCTVGAFCSIFRPKQNVDYEYTKQLFSSSAYKAHIDFSLSGSAINNLKNSDIESIEFYVPPRAIQKKIARILKTTDQAIESTEALIEKYQQIKAGLMQDLFTRGIGADGKLRPSREQAPELYRETPIGWIPREWTISKLGSMSKIVSGVTLGSKEGPYDTIDAPYLRVANVQDGYLDLSEIKTVRISQKTLEHLKLLPGDVLMNEGGDFDKLGRGAVWAGEIEGCVHQNHVFRVRTDANVLNPYYLAYYSESALGKKYFLISSKQSTNLASINSTQLNAYPIAFPSIAEQEEIVSRIGCANARINSLKAEAEKLRCQKSGLMHDLLTGKVTISTPAKEDTA